MHVQCTETQGLCERTHTHTHTLLSAMCDRSAIRLFEVLSADSRRTGRTVFMGVNEITIVCAVKTGKNALLKYV